jgi:hypothetical protein
MLFQIFLSIFIKCFFIVPMKKQHSIPVIVTMVIMTIMTVTSTNMANVNAQTQGNGDTQPDRVGSHDTQTSPNGANAGGTVTDPTITGDPTVVDSGDTVKTDCFGKVISFRAQEHKENPDEGTLGSHASDPVPELPGNETPRQGIGNQDQGHPAAHGAFNSQFQADDAENLAENCY